MSKHINEVFTNEHVVRENVIQFTVPDFCLFTFLLLFDLILLVEVHIGATQRFLDNCTYMRPDIVLLKKWLISCELSIPFYFSILMLPHLRNS